MPIRRVLLLLVCAIAVAGTAGAAPTRNVLLLHSYHNGYTWTDALTEGIRTRFQDERAPTEVWVEYLDTQRERGPGTFERMMGVLQAKYASHPPSVIIAADDAAVEFLLANGDTLFPDVPVVFCGLNNYALVPRLPRSRFTGVLEQFSVRRILELALQLQPRAKRVFVVSEDTLTGDVLRGAYADAAARWPHLEFVFLNGSTLTFDEILARLGDAAPDDLVVTSQFHLDHTGALQPGHEGVSRIVQASRAPVLSSVVSDVTTGLLIGSENAGLVHGRQAAALALRVLAGTPPSALPVEQDQPPALLLNATALEERGITTGPLPSWVRVVNERPSFLREHRYLVAGTLAFIALQTVAIAMLVLAIRSRRRAEERLSAQARELARSNDDLERVNASLTAEQHERQRAEERLRHAQKMDAVGRLAGGVAHDFNNLLTVIRGYSDLVLSTTDPADTVHASIDEIRKAADRAASLTHQLLAFSRKQVLQPRVIDLNTVVAEMEKMLTRLIGEDITLATELEPRLPAVLVDEGEWQQVIVNLAVNARDAMPHGGTLTVRTRAVDHAHARWPTMPQMPGGRYVVLEVCDTGVGMDHDVQARIFEPFFTTKERGKGVGLGLSTVYGIVKQSGGWIWVETTPGAGTTFRVYLPTTDAAPPVTAAPAPAAKMPATETVLLVEDQEDVRRLAAQVLRGRGYTVLEAGGGEQALALAAAHPYPIHLVVTDVVMPGMRGPDVVARLLARQPSLRVLYISGYTDDVMAQPDGGGLGGPLLEKPFTPQALAARVRAILDEQVAR